MKISIFGTGYVGLVTGVCLADFGSNVLCIDVDKRKIDMLKNKELPIYEPGLDVFLERNVMHGRLNFHHGR
jgi:UDPglucose 6-dehydrogenase